MRDVLRPARPARIQLLEKLIEHDLNKNRHERYREKLNRLKAEELIGLPDERTYGSDEP